MCISSRPSRMSSTILFAGECDHPNLGLVHLLGYQNTAVNLNKGPNAMILPIPSAVPMGPKNLLDTEKCPGILKDMAQAIKPKTLGRRRGAKSFGLDAKVQIFTHGIYTVVLASDAKAIPAALRLVEARKRPAIKKAFFDFFADEYPGYHIAVCCFDNSDAKEARPLLWWYEPADQDTLFAPAVDAHDGEIPDLKSVVNVDHTVVFGSDLLGTGSTVNYSDTLSAEISSLLPQVVVGRSFTKPMTNGDFLISVDSVRQGDLQTIRRGILQI